MKEKWSIGKIPSTVVSDTKVKNTNFPVPPNVDISDESDIEYYGGYLICESIGNNKHANLIASAPDLLRCLKEAIEDVELERNKAPENWYEAVKNAES